MNQLVPVGTNYSLTKASQILVVPNGIGNSGLMHMLYSSSRNNNYFEVHRQSSFVEDFRRYPELLNKFNKRLLGLRDLNLIANFELKIVAILFF